MFLVDLCQVKSTPQDIENKTYHNRQDIKVFLNVLWMYVLNLLQVYIRHKTT